MSIRRGDIFYVFRGDSSGSEQRAGRPAIIVSNALCNANSRVVEVVFLTCQEKTGLPTHVLINSTGRASTALCEQITSVDIKRLGNYVGHATESEMAELDKALAISLGLPVGQPNKHTGPVSDSEIAMIALRFLERFVKSNQNDLSVRPADR